MVEILILALLLIAILLYNVFVENRDLYKRLEYLENQEKAFLKDFPVVIEDIQELSKFINNDLLKMYRVSCYAALEPLSKEIDRLLEKEDYLAVKRVESLFYACEKIARPLFESDEKKS